MGELSLDDPQSCLGRAVAELETPVAVVDLDLLERNVARAAAYAAEHGLALLPHLKTHKTIDIASRQLAAGAAGLTVAKSSEAASFAVHLQAPLLLHYPAFGEAKWRRIAAVAGQVPLTVALDSWEAAEPLAAALRARGVSAEVLIEIDVGMGRTGVPAAAALGLAQEIERRGRGLVVAGISCYPGHLRGDDAAIRAGLRAVDERLRMARDEILAAGIRCDRVSGGSTATLFHSHETSMTELRPGNYVFLDRGEGRGAWSAGDCALQVHATVVSTSVAGRMALDAGAKALGEAGPPSGLEGYGAIAADNDVKVAALNEEHAVCQLPGEGTARYRVGDRVAVIPNHACTCANQHDFLIAARDGLVVEVLPLIARGAVR